MLAVGTQESGDTGRERIDLVAFRVETDRFGDSRAREEVCSMSAHRSFGLTLTNGFVIVEQESLRGLNIGSLCFNEIVKWARRVAPDDHVMPIQLLGSHVGAYGSRNLERRHRFYQRFGLTFEFESGDVHPLASGESKDMVGRDLISHSMAKFPNIVEVDLLATLQSLAMAQEELADDARGLKDGIASLLAERRRRSDVFRRVARLLRLPVMMAVLAVGAILARPGHFGLHL
ncbi:hypothetical protein LGM85_14385 [Burkholderia multivorans]|nr:hypothetical protein [Burkholderia multivorans]MBU9366531.1 hypothetical protein [Burkholderia multivorans]MCA8485122.1 hypothetical protein [Burkholderia multivorans]